MSLIEIWAMALCTRVNVYLRIEIQSLLMDFPPPPLTRTFYLCCSKWKKTGGKILCSHSTSEKIEARRQDWGKFPFFLYRTEKNMSSGCLWCCYSSATGLQNCPWVPIHLMEKESSLWRSSFLVWVLEAEVGIDNHYLRHSWRRRRVMWCLEME